MDGFQSYRFSALRLSNVFDKEFRVGLHVKGLNLPYLDHKLGFPLRGQLSGQIANQLHSQIGVLSHEPSTSQT